MSRAPTIPPALAGVDLDAHRERALRVLALFFGGDLSKSPAEWEERARGVIGQLERYGLAPVHLYDPGLYGGSACAARRALLGEGPGS